MTRGLNSSVQSESKKADVRLEWLVRLEFDSDDFTAWTGIGGLNALGFTFTGAGDLANISTIEESTDLQATTLRLSLSGVPSELISTALDTDYKNRPAKVWFAFIDDDGNIVGEAHQIFRGKMDVMTINETLDSPTISVEATSVLADLNDPNERRWTPEDQKIEHPNDEFFEFVPKIGDQEVIWDKE